MEFKVGDVVVISNTPESYPYYANGDIAKLHHIDRDGDWWADFKNLGNRSVNGNGIWCIGNNTTRSSCRFAIHEDEQMTTNQHFKTQAELWLYLQEKEGRRVEAIGNGIIVGFNAEGKLWNFTDNRSCSANMANVENWQPYEPKPWHEGVEPGTVPCWFWNSDTNDVGTLGLFRCRVDGLFYNMHIGWGYRNCRP